MSLDLHSGQLLVIVGPSGVGKGTLLAKVFGELDRLIYSISVTTRSMRAGEIEGKHYFFCSEPEFRKLIERDQFLEWAEFVGNLYGTPRAFVQEQLEAGYDVILEIELDGAKQIKAAFPEAFFIFISPPSLEALYERLKLRSTEPEEKIRARLAKAELELAEIDWFDRVIVNHEGQVEDAARELKESILKRRRANALG